MDHDFADADIEGAEVSGTAVKIHFNPNDLVEPHIFLEQKDLIFLCKALGVKSDELSD